MKRLIAAFLLAGALATSQEASAACVRYGVVERIYQTGSTTWVYMRNLNANLISSHYYLFRTTDPDLARAALRALNGGYVRIIGNASRCPTSGTVRNDGVIQSIWFIDMN